MGDAALIGNTVVLGIIVVLLALAVIGLNMSGTNTATANFALILSFFLIVAIIAIPFLEVNTQLAGTVDTRTKVKDAIYSAIGFTTGIFVAFLIITFMIIRRYPTKISLLVNSFTALSFFMSLLTITLFTLQKTFSPCA